MGKPCSLAIFNINSFGAGIHGIWENSEGKYGVKEIDSEK